LLVTIRTVCIESMLTKLFPLFPLVFSVDPPSMVMLLPFDRFPATTPLSLECDVFPTLVREGVRIKVVPCECSFLDIGRESTLREADSFVERHMEWFR